MYIFSIPEDINVKVLIPYTVTGELDGLSKNRGNRGKQAVAATKFIKKQLEMKAPKIEGIFMTQLD